MSVNATNAIPIAAGTRVLKSSNDTVGTLNAGSPAGTSPTTGISSARPRAATITVAPTTATNTPGTFGATRRRPRMTTSDPTPMASAVALVSSSPATKSRSAGIRFSASTEKPNSFGSCATTTVTAMPIR